jgi:hypothetical protein
MDFHSDDDATSLSDLVTTSRIKTVVRQEYDVVPNNGTSFAYFEQRDCGSCGSSSEEGTAMLLTSGQCQTLPSNFTSFFFKFGDSVQTVNLQVFNQAACVGEAESESISLIQSAESVANALRQLSTNGMLVSARSLMMAPSACRSKSSSTALLMSPRCKCLLEILC